MLGGSGYTEEETNLSRKGNSCVFSYYNALSTYYAEYKYG